MSECRTECVFGRQFVGASGKLDAPLFICAEAPGKQELKWGRPLVGPAGQLLDKLLTQVGIDSKNTYKTNACCCVDMDREIKKPNVEELIACKPRLLDEMAASSSKLILLLGGTSQEQLIPGIRITAARGKFRAVDIGGSRKVLLSTYHPSAILRGKDEYRQLVLEDLALAKRFIES